MSTFELAINSKHETRFNLAARLRSVHAQGTEPVTGRVARRPKDGELSADEEAMILKGRRQRNRPSTAARTKDQIDSLLTSVAGARNILSSPGE